VDKERDVVFDLCSSQSAIEDIAMMAWIQRWAFMEVRRATTPWMASS
jgi:hypothetical protein